MSTITAVLEPQADGTVRLPVPEELRGGQVRVTATLEAVGDLTPQPNASPEMIRRRQEAFANLRRLNPFRELRDPVAWQKEIRVDRPIPGRE